MIASGGMNALKAAIQNKYDASLTATWNVFGSTSGQVNAAIACSKDPTSLECEDKNIRLKYVTAWGSLRINEAFSSYMSDWRLKGGTCPFHTGQIEYGESQKFMGAWI